VSRGLIVALGSAALAFGLSWFIGGQALVWAAAMAFGINWIVWIPASIWKTEHYYDLTGSASYLAVIVVTLVLAPAVGPSAVLIAALVAIWAIRLGWYLFGRVRRTGKDRRFDQLKQTPMKFLVAWSLQGLWVYLTLLAAVLQISAPAAPIGLIEVVGAGIWALGFGIEVVADRQKAAFRADPANADRFVHTGLWALSRHPNYFGEIVLWTGIFLAGAGRYQGAGWLAVLSPIFVAFLLVRGSGIPILEAAARQKWGKDPAWQRYVAKTPVLVPWLGP
jgi:steroid 5-alpha reductase family enzyme